MNPMRWTVLCLMLATALGVSAAPQAPDQEIRAATEKLQANIREHRAQYQADSAKFYAMADREIVPHFDTRAIGQLVLGRHWKDASPAQRERFVNAFKNALVHSYADALLKYADTTKAEWKPLHMAAGASEATVNADLVRPGGPPIPIGFAVHQQGDGWKVYDVIVEGISIGTTFRAQFNSEIGKNGLDSAIARLESGGKPLADDAITTPKK